MIAEEGPLSARLRVRPRTISAEPATVSVVIPCYNYARYLLQAAESVLSQQQVLVSVIIVDDASTDDSLSVARWLADSDSRVTVIAHTRNQGPVATFNRGLTQADGEFVVRLDADDLLTPGSLARAVDVARAFPSVGLVYGHPIHFEGETLPAPRSIARFWVVWPGRRWLADRCRQAVNVITAPEVLMRRSVVQRVGGQMPLAHTHDMEMWLRIAAFSDVAYIQGPDQAWHRDHENSLSAREVDGLQDLIDRRAAFETLLSGRAGRLPEAPELLQSARTALATEALAAACSEFDCGRGADPVIQSLIAFAHEVNPEIHSLSSWKPLDRRIRLGHRRASLPQWSFLPRASRRLSSEIRKLRWRRTGVFFTHTPRKVATVNGGAV